MEGAVVSFAEGAVNGLLGKLGSVLADKALLLGGVRGEIQYIKDELESMHGFLIVQAQREDCDHLVNIWMKQVREMAYDAEDCIDKFRYRVDKPCGKGLSGRIRKSALVLRTLKARCKIATEIQELRRRTREVSERQQRYHAAAGVSSMITSPAGDSLTPYPQFQALYPEQVQPVGFDKHRDQIIGWLMDDQNRRRLTIISIVGFGGLGKTTLAKMAYESPNVKAGHFKCRAFVAISQRFNIKLLLADILQQVHQILEDVATSEKDDQKRKAAKKFLEEIKNWDLHKLRSELQEYLKDKRYVIILDDIWAASAWEQLKIALPDCTNGSRIIVTTRIESVANECSSGHKPYIYKMKPLDFETSEMLFYKRIFGKNDPSLSGEWKEVSKNILKKCGGMPLAINSIAGLLANKPKQREQWETVLNSLGSEIETNPTLEGMRKILSLSYQDLPHYLKTCFLYLSVYPEDYEIRRKCLMRRWIAEGFVCRKRGLSAEKVAQSYFDELVNRNMVIPIGISSFGEIKSIRVHDMMLEIIVSKSLEENFVSLVDGEYNLIHDKIRRLSVQSTGQDNLMPSKNINLAHTRSLTIFGNPNKWIKSKQLRLVRVLDLEGNREIRDDNLKYLCRMFQLKYLSLRGTNISRLPPKIRKLQNLETIDIRDTNIRKLPSGIVKLQNLTHFYGGSCYCGRIYKDRSNFLVLPPGVQNMKNIQTLTQIYLNKGSVIQELGELAQITKLGVCFPHAKKEPFCSALEKLSVSLRTLQLELENPHDNSFQFLDSLNPPPTLLRSLELCGRLEKLPHWFPSLNNLTELKLYFTRHLNQDAFEVLQKLPSLIILNQFRAYHAEKLIFVEEGFPSLRVFIFYAIKIPVLRFNERAAPMLEKLVLVCEVDMGAFSGIEYLKNLKEIALKLPKGDDFGRVVEDLRKAADSNPNKPKFTVEYF